PAFLQRIALERRARQENHSRRDLARGKDLSMSTPETAAAPVPAAQDFMPLLGIDHVELYVGNAAQAAFFYTRAFGFREVAYAGLETGVRDHTSHVLEQGRIRLVLTG